MRSQYSLSKGIYDGLKVLFITKKNHVHYSFLFAINLHISSLHLRIKDKSKLPNCIGEELQWVNTIEDETRIKHKRSYFFSSFFHLASLTSNKSLNKSTY